MNKNIENQLKELLFESWKIWVIKNFNMDEKTLKKEYYEETSVELFALDAIKKAYELGLNHQNQPNKDNPYNIDYDRQGNLFDSDELTGI